MTYSQQVSGHTYQFDGLVELMATASPQRSGDELAGCAASSDAERAAAQWALACLLADAKLLQDFDGPARDFWRNEVYAHPLAGPIAKAVESIGGAPATDTLARVMRVLDDAEARAAVAAMAAEVDRITEGDEERLRAHFDACIRTVDLERTRAAQDTLDAEKKDDTNDARVKRIEMIRDTHRRHGGNPSAVPRSAV